MEIISIIFDFKLNIKFIRFKDPTLRPQLFFSSFLASSLDRYLYFGLTCISRISSLHPQYSERSSSRFEFGHYTYILMSIIHYKTT